MVLGFSLQININDIWLELIRICSGAILKCWYGWILSNVDYTYYISLWFKETRQRGRFAGFSLFISNSSTKENFTQCYKDGPLLPPLNFTATCVFYNYLTTNIHKFKSIIHLYIKKKYFITVRDARRRTKCTDIASLSQHSPFFFKTHVTDQNVSGIRYRS